MKLVVTGALALSSAACASAGLDGDEGGSVVDAAPDAADGGEEEPVAPQSPPVFVWDLPPGFPVPVVPPGNPMSEAKLQLGRRLFYDVRLSDNQTQSCGSCHQQSLAFTDGRATSLGSTGQEHTRSAMSLANVAYASSLTWANPLFAMGSVPEPIERQSQLPLYGDSPVELGLRSQSEIEGRLRALPEYAAWFAEAFPMQVEPITAQNIGRALATFQRVIISGRSPFDRYRSGEDAAALSEAATRGFELFQSERLSCSQCHAGFALSDHVHSASDRSIALPYHNTGLYNLKGSGAYPEPNTGVFNVTERASDMGKFKAPTLRNIAVTAPYMHDGSIATLSDVLDHYAAGGRSLPSGNGHDNPYKDPLVHGFTLAERERADVLAFLDSLTDRAFLENPALSDPWQE